MVNQVRQRKRRTLLAVVAAFAFAGASVIVDDTPTRTASLVRGFDVSRVQLGGEAEPFNGSTPATYVGKAVCRECHQENFALHAQHGHASTFHMVPDTSLPERFAGKEFDGGKVYGTYRYEVDEQGNLFALLPEKFDAERFPLQYALGSGQHAQTMLTLATSLDGQTEAIEHRVSCYHNERLGITPGHSRKQPASPLELFGDVPRGEPLRRCIYCHTTRGQIDGETIVGLVASVNCEKCHGPGSKHVQAARRSATPPKYSVGQSTWDAESEIQLCGDCHRLPKSASEKDIREYPDHLARFQPIGMLRSRCYLESDGQMRCTTCHSPHTTIQAVSAAEHLGHCIQCHDPQHDEHSICPVSEDTGCVDCHMPRIEMDEGLIFHDHWIRVLDD